MKLLTKIPPCAAYLALWVLIFSRGPFAKGAVIYESGALGKTGVSTHVVLDQLVLGSNVNAGVFQGVRFELPKAAKISRVGGHFVGFGPGGAPTGQRGTIFGALISLDSESDLPDSFDLSTPDVLATTVLTLPEASDEIFGDVNLSLDPGWYALVFGSGMFGADGVAGALRNNPDIGIPQYLGRQTTIPNGDWVERTSSMLNQRFVVEGTIIPEPSTFTIIALAIFSFFVHRRHTC